MEKRFVRRTDAARILGVSASTLTRWAKKGLVPTMTTIGGHHRYLLTDIEALRDRLITGGVRGDTSQAVGAGDSWGAATAATAVAERNEDAFLPKATGSDMVEIRWHGRGGQGAVTASELLAEAALDQGGYFQAFPEFGAERTGAPIRAYTRLSDRPIDLHCPITQPDLVVVLDPTLLGVVDVFEGLGDHSMALINSPLSPDMVTPDDPDRKWKVFTVDATTIALETLRRNIPNTAMVGALLKVSPVVDKDACLQVMEKRMSARFSFKVVQSNIQAFERAYAEVCGED